MKENNIHRIIDANINRASEALRVIEEWTRFNNNNLKDSESLKNIRHLINRTFSNIPNLILSRDSEYDVGKEIRNNSKKKSAKDVIRANCKRLEESLRVLAEYGQLLNINILEIEKSRFIIYTIEKELIKLEKTSKLLQSTLYLVTNRSAFSSDNVFFNTISESIKGGIDIIQLREKNEDGKKFLEVAQEIRKLTLESDVLFIINDRVDIAIACNADGVHLGQGDMPISEARLQTPEGFIIGLSTHSIEQGKEGSESGADYLGVGPVYETPTKPDYTPIGLDYVKWASKNISLPWFAIGGINERNIEEVLKAGASKVAVVREIMNSDFPYETTKKLKSKTFKNQEAKCTK